MGMYMPYVSDSDGCSTIGADSPIRNIPMKLQDLIDRIDWNNTCIDRLNSDIHNAIMIDSARLKTEYTLKRDLRIRMNKILVYYINRNFYEVCF